MAAPVNQPAYHGLAPMSQANKKSDMKVIKPKFTGLATKPVKVSKIQSESDAGDMSHYNPNLR